jgi:hypothetical protein
MLREKVSKITYFNKSILDIEHLFRFGKQRLLMSEFQTPDLQHEENWIRLVMLSYVQLWPAKEELCQNSPTH